MSRLSVAPTALSLAGQLPCGSSLHMRTRQTCASRSLRSGLMIPTKSSTSSALATSEITQQQPTAARQRVRRLGRRRRLLLSEAVESDSSTPPLLRLLTCRFSSSSLAVRSDMHRRL
eukprot:scaffold22820_cov61-Phaeocystis_antarctica.AAC.1